MTGSESAFTGHAVDAARRRSQSPRMDADSREARRQRVLAAVRSVPPGRVASYGDIARLAGLPGRARWVARVLAESGEVGVPWHRVLRGDGRIAFPLGSAEAREQAARLRGEGVAVAGVRVEAAAMRRATLDELLWSPPGIPGHRRRGPRGG